LLSPLDRVVAIGSDLSFGQPMNASGELHESQQPRHVMVARDESRSVMRRTAGELRRSIAPAFLTRPIALRRGIGVSGEGDEEPWRRRRGWRSGALSVSVGLVGDAADWACRSFACQAGEARALAASARRRATCPHSWAAGRPTFGQPWLAFNRPKSASGNLCIRVRAQCYSY